MPKARLSKSFVDKLSASEDDLIYQRPGTGLMPYETDKVVGREVKVDITKKERISLSHLK